jgi:hypothetical protein
MAKASRTNITNIMWNSLATPPKPPEVRACPLEKVSMRNSTDPKANGKTDGENEQDDHHVIYYRCSLDHSRMATELVAHLAAGVALSSVDRIDGWVVLAHDWALSPREFALKS